MFGQISKRLTKFIAMACLAIACLFFVQATIIGLDRLEHALALEHDANPLAGPVQSCGAVPAACSPTSDIDLLSHAHGDIAGTALLVSFPALAVADFTPTTFLLAGARFPPSAPHFAPDRPPKR